MRSFLIIIVLLFCEVTFSAPTYWTGLRIINDGIYSDGLGYYGINGYIYGESSKHARILSSMFGHSEAGFFYLKHEDFSLASMNPTYNWWALALYGDVVSEATFDSLTRIEDFRGNDWNTGGTQVASPNDFYMAFKVSEVLKDVSGYSEGQTWYGWVHVSVDENLEMSLLEDGINLTGGAVTVGATPEPSSALLLLVGGALLALRRSRNVKHISRTRQSTLTGVML